MLVANGSAVEQAVAHHKLADPIAAAIATTIPLKSELAAKLQRYIDSRPRDVVSMVGKASLVWPGNWSEVAAEMIRIDLKSAMIPYTDEHGHDYDFHALRHQFITNLKRAGVSLKDAQVLSRHSNVNLTANVYSHTTDKEQAASVEKLVAVPTGKRNEPEEARATGTFGAERVLGQQVLETEGISGDNGQIRVFGDSNRIDKKSPQNTSFTGFE